jgi:hypothetical protein
VMSIVADMPSVLVCSEVKSVVVADMASVLLCSEG